MNWLPAQNRTKPYAREKWPSMSSALNKELSVLSYREVNDVTRPLTVRDRALPKYSDVRLRHLSCKLRHCFLLLVIDCSRSLFVWSWRKNSCDRGSISLPLHCFSSFLSLPFPLFPSVSSFTSLFSRNHVQTFCREKRIFQFWRSTSRLSALACTPFNLKAGVAITAGKAPIMHCMETLTYFFFLVICLMPQKKTTRKEKQG